ncbi:MAG: sugar transferase [Verrucomicrobia bacterium]|nr:sugar transferase [Verrucomicrobiota bacterium]
MLQRDRQMRVQVHQWMDALLFVLGFWLAYELRASQQIIEWLKLTAPSPFETFLWLYVILIPAALFVLESQGFYNRPMLCTRRAIAWPLFRGCGIITGALVLTAYFFELTVARGVIISFGIISFVLIYLKEEALLRFYRSQLAQAQYRRRFVLVGAGEDTARLREELRVRPDASMEIVAELELNKATLEQLLRLLHERSINGVILSARHAYFEQAEIIIKACELEGVEAWVVADFFSTQISRASLDVFYGRPVMVFRSAPEYSWQSVLKLGLDFFGALIMVLILSPLFAIVALVIKLTSPGPILFRQHRSGLNGAPFTIYKFRTMVTNAEQLKHELEAMNEMRGPVFKVTKDPRITPIGKFLRRHSIDELPQLFNVLRGEMSLVGPRPLPVDEVKRFNDLAHRRRLSVKPGLTCLWQVSGRSQIVEFKDWVRLDLEYIDNWSLWLDLKILCRTIPVVFTGTGAK